MHHPKLWKLEFAIIDPCHRELLENPVARYSAALVFHILTYIYIYIYIYIKTKKHVHAHAHFGVGKARGLPLVGHGHVRGD